MKYFFPTSMSKFTTPVDLLFGRRRRGFFASSPSAKNAWAWIRWKNWVTTRKKRRQILGIFLTVFRLSLAQRECNNGVGTGGNRQRAQLGHFHVVIHGGIGCRNSQPAEDGLGEVLFFLVLGRRRGGCGLHGGIVYRRQIGDGDRCWCTAAGNGWLFGLSIGSLQILRRDTLQRQNFTVEC